MKRRLWLIMFALCMILTAAGTALTAPAPAAAYELEYAELSDGTLEITGFTGEAAGELRLPDAINGKRVTEIGDYAFVYCSGFTSLVIPDSVTEIGEGAFEGCEGFTGSLVIPDSVTQIGKGAFFGCSGFTGSLVIPDSVTGIGASAFDCCSGFTGSLVIPDSVTQIGSGPFACCSGLTSIEVAADNPNYRSINGVLYSKDGKRLIQCPGGKTGKLTIPDSVTEIGDCAFGYCSGFTGSLVIPDSVTEIGVVAFCDCSGFTGSLVIPDSVTEIGDSAFSGCNGLTSIEVAADNPNYRSINGVLYSKDGKRLIQCPGGKTGKLVIPDSVTQIGDSAFWGCSGLTSIEVAADNPNYCSINGILYSKDGKQLIQCPGGKTGKLTIPDSVTYIGDDAFFWCSGLTDVYYSGTEEEWKAISIGDNNEPLLDAKIHYNSGGNILLWVLLAVLSLGGGVLAFILFKRRRA